MIKSLRSTNNRSELIRPVGHIAVIVFLGVLPLFVRTNYLLHVFILVLIYIIVTSSMRLIMTSGQFPLGHAAFMGIGAYLSGVLSKNLDLALWLTIPIGALVSMCVGIFIGYPFARLKTFYYAMVSLFFGVGILQAIQSFGEITGGVTGITNIPALFNTTSKVPNYYFFLGLTLISLLVLYRVEFCRIGRSLKAIDQSDLVAGSVGIDVAKYRVVVLAVGCFFVGLAGAMYAHYNITLSPTSFDMSATLWLVMYVLIGGQHSFYGPIIGTTVLLIIPELFRVALLYTPFITAGVLFIVIFLVPDGIISIPALALRHFKKTKAKEVTNQ
jgi:branched-chain amino acid transport system permease protein